MLTITPWNPSYLSVLTTLFKTRFYNLGKTGHFDMNTLANQNKEELDKNINDNDVDELEENIPVLSGNVYTSNKRDDLVVPGQIIYFYRKLRTKKI